MPELQFEMEGAEPVARTVTPQIAFHVHIRNAVANEAIHSVALRCQIQLEPVRRRYTAEEQLRLTDLFGAPERWSQTLHPLHWTQVSLTVPGFTGATALAVPVHCSFDFDVAVTKYIHGLEQGDIPVTLLFSGTIYYAGRTGLQVAQIPWDREVSWRLPVQVWKDMMDLYYPNTAWLCLRRDAFERLLDFKTRNGIPSWEQTIDRMLGSTVEVR